MNIAFINAVQQYILMIHEVFISSLEELPTFLNPQFEYQLLEDGTLKCQNPLILLSTCLHIYKEIGRAHYAEIEDNGVLKLPIEKRRSAVSFLNRLTWHYCEWMTEDYQAEALIQYLQSFEDVCCTDLKMVLKVKEEFDDTLDVGKYICCFYYRESSIDIITNFYANKLPCSQESRWRRVEMLIETPCSTLCSDRGQFAHSSGVKWQYHQKESVQVYGNKEEVGQFIQSLKKQVKNIKEIAFSKGDQFLTNMRASLHLSMCESYRKIKSFIDEDSITILYFSEFQPLFERDRQVYAYQLKKMADFKGLSKDRQFMQFKDESSDLCNIMVKQDQMIMASSEMIQRLQAVNNRLERRLLESYQSKKKKKNQLVEKEDFSEEHKAVPEFVKNIEVRSDNYEKFIQMCSSLKYAWAMTYRIEYGNFVRITNWVRECRKIYIVFHTFAELIQLQGIIQDKIPLAKVGQVLRELNNEFFPSKKQLVLEGREVCIVCYPIGNKMEGQFNESQFAERERDYNKLVNIIRNDKDSHNRTVVCTCKTALQLLHSQAIDFYLTLAINQQFPNFQKMNEKMLGQCVTKHTNSKHFDVEAGVVRDMLTADRSRQDYEIGDYPLSAIDQYNITAMFGSGRKETCVILAHDGLSSKTEFVYFTYHQKLVRVIRAEDGKFVKFADASMSKGFARSEENILKAMIKKCFITGQQLLSISIPFEHAKMVNSSEITRLSNGNQALIAYHMERIESSNQFKVWIRPPATGDHLQQCFSKQYRLSFDDKQLKSILKTIDLGYGHLQKWRQQSWVCLEADTFICLRILQQFQEIYRARAEKAEKVPKLSNLKQKYVAKEHKRGEPNLQQYFFREERGRDFAFKQK